VCNRIVEAVAKEKTGLAENQYCFRRGRSTVDARYKQSRGGGHAGAGTIYQRQLLRPHRPRRRQCL